MRATFRNALIWHLENYAGTMAEISRATGVSIDTLKKLKSRPGSSTTAEHAVKIAAFYGKTLEQFMSCQNSDEEEKIASMLSLVSSEEKNLFLLRFAASCLRATAKDLLDSMRHLRPLLCTQ